MPDPQIEFFLGHFFWEIPKNSASADRNLKISAAQIEMFHPASPAQIEIFYNPTECR